MIRIAWLALAGCLWLASAVGKAEEIPLPGQQLAAALDAMPVERLWLAGHPIDWRSGERISPAPGQAHVANHSAAFVAAVCERLGIDILRPPHHPESHLTNDQCRWLPGPEARKLGWRPVKSAEEAQHLANQGQLVVAAFENPDRRHPGHLAIVRPAVLSHQHLHDYGPQIIQAGQHNYRSASLATGFEPYPLAWGDRYVRFFAHPVAWKP